MRGLEIQPFSREHVEPARGLLDVRHARHVAAEPLLRSNVGPHTELDALVGKDASGVVALRDGRVVGYLLGVQRPEEHWGPNIWVEYAGHAAEEPEIVRDLYAAAAGDWVERGLTRHYVYAPATDARLVDAWFRLSFGAQHAAAIREVPERVDGSPPGVEVRPAAPDDLDAAVRLDVVLPEHQQGSPVFAPVSPLSEEEIRDEYAQDLPDPETGVFIAELDGRPVASLIMVPVEKSGMHSGLARPARAALLAFAATLPEARGSGAGIALTNAGLEWARRREYPVVVTDWRETNLLSSRFWPSRGFRRTFLRLYRSIP